MGFNPDNIIAPFWDDLVLFPSNNGYIGYDDSTQGEITIEWNNISRFPANETTMSFKTTLYSDGCIKLSYGSLMGTSAFITASIGIENQDGSVGYSPDTATLNGCGSQGICNQAQFESLENKSFYTNNCGKCDCVGQMDGTMCSHGAGTCFNENCLISDNVLLYEVHVGVIDYFVLINPTDSPIDVTGYVFEYEENSSPIESITLLSSVTIPARESWRFVESGSCEMGESNCNVLEADNE